jgi:hypothetical protein
VYLFHDNSNHKEIMIRSEYHKIQHNAPDEFMCLMNVIFIHYMDKFVNNVFFDDILIYSKSK